MSNTRLDDQLVDSNKDKFPQPDKLMNTDSLISRTPNLEVVRDLEKNFDSDILDLDALKELVDTLKGFKDKVKGTIDLYALNSGIVIIQSRIQLIEDMITNSPGVAIVNGRILFPRKMDHDVENLLVEDITYNLKEINKVIFEGRAGGKNLSLQKIIEAYSPAIVSDTGDLPMTNNFWTNEPVLDDNYWSTPNQIDGSNVDNSPYNQLVQNDLPDHLQSFQNEIDNILKENNIDKLPDHLQDPLDIVMWQGRTMKSEDFIPLRNDALDTLGRELRKLKKQEVGEETSSSMVPPSMTKRLSDQTTVSPLNDATRQMDTIQSKQETNGGTINEKMSNYITSKVIGYFNSESEFKSRDPELYEEYDSLITIDSLFETNKDFIQSINTFLTKMGSKYPDFIKAS